MQEISMSEMRRVEGGFIFVAICAVLAIGMIAITAYEFGAAVGSMLCSK